MAREGPQRHKKKNLRIMKMGFGSVCVYYERKTNRIGLAVISILNRRLVFPLQADIKN